MFLETRSLLLAITLAAAPMSMALAQHNNPTANAGANDSATATPGTADNSPGSSITTADMGSKGTTVSNYAGSPIVNSTPGATGKTVVPGSTSSQAGTAAGTVEQQKGSVTSGGGR